MRFGSDNQAGASEQVLAAITDAYRESDTAYGADRHTSAAVEALRELFERDLDAFFVSSGTAANMLALSAMVQPWEGVICHHQAHVLLDESTGPAMFAGGAALLPVPDRTVRLTADEIAARLTRLPAEPPHNVRPAAISVTQANECGQIHTVDEIAAIGRVARDAGLRFHMDGARFANAVAALDVAPADVTWRAGVDVLCLGATKNGAVAAEAVVFFDRALAVDFDYRMKRTGHLTSKARLYGAQFVAWLSDGHWLDLARRANAMAASLRSRIDDLDGIRLAWPSESNETFVLLDRGRFDALLGAGVTMYEWYPDAMPAAEGADDPTDDEVLARLVTSFQTTDDDISAFAAAVAM